MGPGSSYARCSSTTIASSSRRGPRRSELIPRFAYVRSRRSPAPLDLDATAWPWPLPHADAVLCANMIHIAPWEAAQGLLRGAARVLPVGGPLLLYGPFVVDGETAPSNREFDASLRARDPRWGVRELRDVEREARAHGLELAAQLPMPANNLTLVLRRR